jgi:DNA polymerase-3 subunit delta'
MADPPQPGTADNPAAESGTNPETLPVLSLFDGVVGQKRAVGALRSAARRPVHAYLLHGPPGSGKRTAGRALAAALLCPEGGCGHCATCHRVLRGAHPDLVEIERSGAALEVDEARSIVVRAQNRPLEATRQVLVVDDVHLAGKAVPALLKTVEEPPPTTVFVLIADDTPPELATIVSRCVTIPFDPVPEHDVAAWLVGRGVDPAQARAVAGASGGRLDRAELLVGDPGFAARQEQWRAVPSRLDGSGAAAAAVAEELLAAVDEAVTPLRQQHARELVVLAEEAEAVGNKGIAGRRGIEDRHRREERRWRTDDLRFGLATLAGVYRDKVVSSTEGTQGAVSPGVTQTRQRAVRQVAAIEQATQALPRNPNESLLMDALMVVLSGMDE